MVLSYRHGFHAGNFADVLKHTTVALLLQHFHAKPKPFYYLDTHAGAAIHRLTDAYAQKTREYLGGIGRIWSNRQYPTEMEPYLSTVRMVNHLHLTRPGTVKSTISYAKPMQASDVEVRRRVEYSWRHLLHTRQQLLGASSSASSSTTIPDLSSLWPDEAFELESLIDYPGSPLISSFFQRQAGLRSTGKTELDSILDRAVLCELHSTEVEELKQYYSVPPKLDESGQPLKPPPHLLSQLTRSRTHVMQYSGFHALQSTNPNLFLAPPQGRGLILIDPPFELAEEQNQLLEAVPIAYNRFRNGVYAIWYPIIDHHPKKIDVDVLKAKLQATGIPKMLNVEFDMTDSVRANKRGQSPAASTHLPTLDAASTFSPDRQRGLGMVGTGMIIINPPYQFEDRMRTICEYLADTLPTPAIVDGVKEPQTFRAKYSIEWITSEKTGAIKAVSVVPSSQPAKGKAPKQRQAATDNAEATTDPLVTSTP